MNLINKFKTHFSPFNCTSTEAYNTGIPLSSSEGHIGWALRCLSGPGGRDVPVQHVGPGVGSGRDCHAGGLWRAGTPRERGVLDQSGRRRIRRSHQGTIEHLLD